MKILVLSGYDDPEFVCVLTRSKNISAYGKALRNDAKKLGVKRIKWDYICDISNRYAGYAIVPDDFDAGGYPDLAIYDEDEWGEWSEVSFQNAEKWIKTGGLDEADIHLLCPACKAEYGSYKTDFYKFSERGGIPQKVLIGPEKTCPECDEPMADIPFRSEPI